MATISKQKHDKEKKKIKPITIAYILLCVLIIGAFALFIAGQADRYNALQVQYYRIQEELTRAQAVYADLQYQMAHFDTDAYIEQLARERLGWVMPNEIVFRKITD